MSSARQIVANCVLITGFGIEGVLAQSLEDTGPVELDFGISLSSGYTDNVYATENYKVGDVVTTLSPYATISAQTETYEWSFTAEADLGRYASEASEDYNDALLRAEGRYELGEDAYVFGGLDHAWEHVPRTSPDDVNGIEPTRYTLSSGFAGVSLSFGRADLRIGTNVRVYDYDDDESPIGREINNDDQDRTMTEFGGRAGFQVAPDRTAFVQGVYDGRDYAETPDDFGYDRDSEGFQLGVGIAGKIGDVTGEAMIGILSQDYDDPRFETVTVPDFGLDLTWRPSTRTRLTGVVARSLEETTLFDVDERRAASGYVATSAGVRASHWVMGDLTANGWLWFTQDDYQNVTRTDYVTEAGFGLRYHLTPHVYLGGAYSYEQRTSDAAGADYDEHSILISLGTELEPLDDGTGPRAGFDDGRFYWGFSLGQSSLTTSVDGLRGGQGRLTADFGDDGPVGGVFAGYRADVGDMVVGAELGIEGGDVEWLHDGGREFSVRRGQGVSGDLLFGFPARNDAVFFARAGVVSTRFETDYTRNDTSAARAETEIGLRGGFGAEIPLRDRWSARMEYIFAGYPDYDLGVERQSDNFGNVEATARLGLVYRFADSERAEPVPASFDGLYGGAQIGHGVLSTRNVGPRPEGGMTRFVLDVPRASGGAVAGAYVGYGTTFDAFYLGAELDADLGTSNWNIERDPDGRVVSSDRRGGVAASLRAGYVVNDAFLVYARAGLSSGFFETDYSESGVELSQDDTLSGWSVGLGVEVPLTDNLHVRLDYTHTDFETYEVEYPGGVDSFDPEENLFRIGLTRRF